MISLLSAVISIQIHLFDFAHKRVTGIGARALIVERVLRHGIETGKELLFRNLIAEGLLDGLGLPDGRLQFFELFDERFHKLLVVLAL